MGELDLAICLADVEAAGCLTMVVYARLRLSLSGMVCWFDFGEEVVSFDFIDFVGLDFGDVECAFSRFFEKS